MVMVLCVGSEHTAGSAQHAGWQHRHMAHEVNLNNNGSSSSPLAFHFHRCASAYQDVASLLCPKPKHLTLSKRLVFATLVHPVPRAGTTLKKGL